MLRIVSKKELPTFLKLGTIKSMTKVADSMAFIRMAIREISAQEAKLVSATGPQAKTAKKLISKFSKLIVKETGKSLNLLVQMNQKVRVYEKELSNVVN